MDKSNDERREEWISEQTVRSIEIDCKRTYKSPGNIGIHNTNE